MISPPLAAVHTLQRRERREIKRLDNMQLAAALVIVALAAGYVARAGWRALTGAKLGCGSACGKCAAPAPPPAPGRIALPQL